MRVLHVIPSVSKQAGGPSQAIFPMCYALRDQGIDVELATTDEGIDAITKASDSHNHERLSLVLFPAQLGRSFKYSRPFSRWLKQNASRYDLVHIHAVFNHACIAAAWQCREQNVPYVVRPLGTLDPWGMNQKSFRKKVFLYGGVKRLLNSAAAIHYTAKTEKEATERLLGLNHGVVIPLGVDLDQASLATEPKQTSTELSTLAGKPYVLVLSRLLPTKGLHVLLSAFLSLLEHKSFGHWRLVLAGDGPPTYVAKLKALAEHANASESVLFPGWLEGETKDRVLRDASLLALPSYHENFGLCVMEALACGVPALISPHVNLSQELETAQAGWVVSVEEEALSAALAEALSSKVERSRRGDAGRKLALRFSWPIIADQLIDLYKSILDEPARNHSTVL